jgi:DNA-binding transcriptional LysR family regulator
MELRHLRYFVAVAEEGSFTQAAETRLHTAQPSLSRQIRDLESDVGAELIIRGPRGMELTAAGRVFLDHARLILQQVEAAAEAARRAARPAKTPFIVGFLTGYELEWLPKVLEILRDELATTELTIHSASSPELMQALLNGRMDVAFLRPDDAVHGLEFRILTNEALFVLLPADHRLARRKSISLDEIALHQLSQAIRAGAATCHRRLPGARFCRCCAGARSRDPAHVDFVSALHSRDQPATRIRAEAAAALGGEQAVARRASNGPAGSWLQQGQHLSAVADFPVGRRAVDAFRPRHSVKLLTVRRNSDHCPAAFRSPPPRAQALLGVAHPRPARANLLCLDRADLPLAARAGRRVVAPSGPVAT